MSGFTFDLRAGEDIQGGRGGWGGWVGACETTRSCVGGGPSVDGGHLVEAVLFGFEPQVGDAVGHVHALSRVGVGAGGRVRRHGAEGRKEGKGYISCENMEVKKMKNFINVTLRSQSLLKGANGVLTANTGAGRRLCL